MKYFVRTLITIILTGSVVWLILTMVNTSHGQGNSIEELKEKQSPKDTLSEKADFIKAVVSSQDSNEKIINVSDIKDLNVPYQIDEQAGKSVRRVFSGKRINIAVIGVDSRLGTNTKHADANHVLSFLVDSGKIEITSIPRDTPADAGFDDTTGLNKLTILYANRGRSEYLKKVAEIAGLDRIHYFIEVGFSHVIGILDWLGYKEPGSALQVLRSRTGLGGDDYQRTYNQGQFIRQTILGKFDKFTGFTGDILVGGGLMLVETNLPNDVAKSIVRKFDSSGFPRTGNDIIIRVRPPVPIDYKIYDLTSPEVIAKLCRKIELFNKKQAEEDTSEIISSSVNPYNRLNAALSKAMKDTAKNPTIVINTLKTYFSQRAWLQIRDISKREYIRDEFGNLLIKSYIRKKQYDNAEHVRRVIESEKLLFANPAGKRNQ